MNLNLDLKFYSLTVIDFFEESKSWQAEEFILNCQDHKKELEEISIRRKNNRYYGCRLEIGHLIDFLRKLLWFNLSGIYPAGMRRDDYELMIKIFKRYTHPTYINKVEAEALPRVLSDKNRSPHFPDIKYKISQILTNIHNQHQDIEHFHDSRKFPEASCPSNR